MTDRTCTVPGCEKAPRSATADWCKMHYHRWYRHGTVDMLATRHHMGSPRRYRTIAAKGHPLAGANGRAYEHRVVLFAMIGEGSHACHWCGTTVTWGPKGSPDELQPDHLNNDGADNRPANLVQSCRRCNTTRALQHRSDELRRIGFWSSNDTIAATRSQTRLPRIA